MANFQEHFTRANKERILKLTAQTAGYHSAHSAVVMPPAGADAAAVTPPPGAGTASPPANGALCCCCWTHGLGKNKRHTATAADMQGGNKQQGHDPLSPQKPHLTMWEAKHTWRRTCPKLRAKRSCARSLMLAYLLPVWFARCLALLFGALHDTKA
jgi:hypothetical protein